VLVVVLCMEVRFSFVLHPIKVVEETYMITVGAAEYEVEVSVIVVVLVTTVVVEPVGGLIVVVVVTDVVSVSVTSAVTVGWLNLEQNELAAELSLGS
jgi:hypothetical protein